MTTAIHDRAATLSVTHEAWEAPLSTPAMSNSLDRHNRIRLTNRFIESSGRPSIPISGEMHFSRVPRAQWDERLRLMKAGGITAVATYVFWIHHEEERGEYRFDGNRDVRAFVELCARIGLDVVLRIGPWCHGEVRNGGFPDWVQSAPVTHRTNDPGYLALAAAWYGRLAAELRGLFGPDSAVIGIQIENELYDQPDHIRALKAMARGAGMQAPIWTATAWGGAQLPDDEVLPLFGGYGDGFWVDFDAPWDASFREHFFFTHVWDDPGIGADLRAQSSGGAPAARPRTPSAFYPAATCELGGGMAKAYHRRPLLNGRDIAAVAHNKIGNGSAWQGYYMYAGGMNPVEQLDLQESHATGYPNDLPRFDYDFGAPVGSTGRLRESHSLLRRQHAFLSAFGELLAPMSSTLPVLRPDGVEDTTTLRWALRSDGQSAFVFVTWHQPRVPLADYTGARFEVVLDKATIGFPAHPVTIPSGTIAHWPVNLTISGTTLLWATASPLTLLEDSAGRRTTLVLAAEPGIEAQLRFGTDTTVIEASASIRQDNGVVTFDPREPTRLTASTGGRLLDVLVLPPEAAGAAFVLEGDRGRELVLSTSPLWVGESGMLEGRCTATGADARRYSTRLREFEAVTVTMTEPAHDPEEASVALVREQQTSPSGYGDYQGRASAPTPAEHSRYARAVAVALPGWAFEPDAELEVLWAGDVIRLLVDGRVVADQYWDGTPWVVDAGSHGITQESLVSLEILPLHPEARVGLPPAAEARRHAVGGALCSLDHVLATVRGRWREVRA